MHNATCALFYYATRARDKTLSCAIDAGNRPRKAVAVLNAIYNGFGTSVHVSQIGDMNDERDMCSRGFFFSQISSRFLPLEQNKHTRAQRIPRRDSRDSIGATAAASYPSREIERSYSKYTYIAARGQACP
ncbi:uncharacterized protein LOC116848158 [Odontomachus brunneus]|uniref:uncharacterized protein LOC116848158 n=1 Tax=Odontomachus brunneus TaxID=486640 RepID=UPI0013F2051C|nr:uncharacterized protein LOC116848158 [Odontomachus brunneus]